ncbi:MAG: hypothetical protein QOF51_569 [Chloroflexota bacterium]|nr:hypothetical protein [Chloroflexota bacterium]
MHAFRGLRRSSLALALALVSMLTASLGLSGPATVPALAQNGATPAQFGQPASPSSTCQLGAAVGGVQHVIYIQFDNTHLRRDNPNVPSDLEQMPSLLNFITQNGTLLTDDHTVLISHTAGGILSSLTGVYPDRHGQIVSNSNVRYNGAGFQFPSSFGYWTDPVVSTAGAPFNMVGPDGSNVPAPWVPFTRAGCNVGGVASANIVLENTGTGPSGDITKVFGNPSPQVTEANTNRAKAQADFVGFAIHCAQNAPVCASGQADVLPQEPGGYVGFKGLFGAQSIDPFLTGQPATAPLNDLFGHPIVDPSGNPGFPGFDGMSAATSLAYVAAMQEKGIPVTYAYISDAHDNHGNAGNTHVAFGPGQDGYVQQLKAYDQAFAAFFARLQAAGITRNNTLFVFTVDEGDHFVGGAPTPASCDGVHIPCTYSKIGEINANIDTLMAEQHPEIRTAFTVHGDDAPTFYLSGNPAQTDPATRAFEQAVGTLSADNPYTGGRSNLLVQMADQTGMKLLHMFTTGDPLRNPTFVLFGDPNYFLTDFPATTCKTCINPAFAWNHGDIQPEIATTWLGFVGPGVNRMGKEDDLWTDHTDVRPTMLRLLGLTDSYVHDGRVLFDILDRSAEPRGLNGRRETLSRLGEAYKQLNAPFGQLAMNALPLSTAALTSSTPGDARYTQIESQLQSLTGRRDALAAQIIGVLNAAEFTNQPWDERRAQELQRQAQAMLGEVGDQGQRGGDGQSGRGGSDQGGHGDDDRGGRGDHS